MYDSKPGDYDSGTERMAPPRRVVYAAKEVKRQLLLMHHRKCCYCEERFAEGAYLDVEHFRPQRGVRQSRQQKKDDPPGYYWLAYAWGNLLLSCGVCNRSYKKTVFPLENPIERARTHHDDLSRERPLLIDPAREDPRAHIRFDEEDPVALTEQGRVTIETVGLGRSPLIEERTKCLDAIKWGLVVVDQARKLPNDTELQVKGRAAREFLKAAQQPTAEFSSMVRDYLEDLQG